MRVYLDYNATTPEDPRVRMTVNECAIQHFGNASSRDHRWGWEAAEEAEMARVEVAAATGVEAPNVTFVSGATEALATVLQGYVGYRDWPTKRIVTCVTEHEAVLAPARYICEQTGVPLHVLPVDGRGHIDLRSLDTTLAGTSGVLVALMYGNNEIGTRHPIDRIAAVTHAHGGRLLCDTTQAIGKCRVNVSADGIDYATISAHKLCGPKGAGALVVGSRGALDDIEPLIVGGGQERNRRGGTLSVPAIVGLGESCRISAEALDDEVVRVGALLEHLEQGILSEVRNVWINGDRSQRLCNTSSVGFSGIEARGLIRDMYDVGVSTKSACSSGKSGPSHVLKAIGLSDEDAYSCIRFSLGRFTTEEEIDYTINKVVASVHKLRRNKSVRM